MFCAAVIRAVHKFGGLLRASVASATNDHRLGANEAPPAIISIFLGEQLADVFEQIAKGAATSSKGKGTHDDRRRHPAASCRPIRATATAPARSPSPATGSSSARRAPVQTVAVPMIIINTIMADSLDYMATELEKAVGDGEDFDTAVQNLLTEIITEHGAVVFNGDGYSENWQIEAAERGLPNLKTTLDALPELIKPEAMELFEKYGVFNHREMHSRYEIRLEQYALTVGVEAKLTLEMGSTVDPAGRDPLPDRAGVKRRGTEGGGRRGGHRAAGSGLGPVAELTGALAASEGGAGGSSAEIGARRGQARAEALLPAMAAVRAAADALEGVVADDLWPLPTYQEMLYIL